MTGAARIITGQLTLSRVTYICDLQQDSGTIIPLGVIAEQTIDNVRALGLIARVQLEPDELAAIGELMREQLTSPFELLKNQLFDWAWGETEPGRALAELSNRFAASLFVTAPETIPVREVVHSSAETIELARRELRDRRDKEFDLLLATCWPDEAQEKPETTKDLAMAEEA